MSGNPTNSTIHSSTMMEFPREKQEALQKRVDARAQSTAHFKFPADHTGKPVHQPKKPTMQPILETPPGQHRQVSQQPMTAAQSNQMAAPMGQIDIVAQIRQEEQLGDARVLPAVTAPVRQPEVAAEETAREEQDEDESGEQPEFTIPNEMPGFTNPIEDADATSLALPSRFGFYKFKDLYVRPFRAKHIAKLQRAHREQSLLPLVEAVSAVMFTTTPDCPAVGFDLTVPDFFFVLYWLRMNSFTKSNFTHTTQCEDPAHLKRVEDAYRLELYAAQVEEGTMTAAELEAITAAVLPEESLKIAEVIRNSTMTIKELEYVPDPEHFCMSDGSALYFRPPTMRDVIEFADAPQMQKKASREEFKFLAELATHFQHRDLLLSLQQRVDIVGEATPDQTQLIKDFEGLTSDYGVDENVVVTCKGCGASRKSKLVLDAFSFLPSN